MENFETPMSSGTPVAVGSVLASGFETGAVEESAFSESPSFAQAEEVEVISSTEDGIADEILASAKENGFKGTLERLAEGEFKENKVDPYDKDQPSKEEEQVLEGSGGEVESEDQTDPEKEALYQEINELKDQINSLSEKNEEFFQRLERAEALLEILKHMQKLAEKKEDEDQIDFWELMVEFVFRFMESIVKGDLATGEDNEADKTTKHGSKKSFDTTDLLEFAQKIKERNNAMPQENIEMQAA